MSTKSAWQSVKMPEYPALKRDTQCHVLVIGGGITGLTAAYLLQQAGKKVCLIERDQLCSGDTKSTTAHLSYVTDKRLTKMVSTFGKEGAKLAWQGGAAAINTIEQIVAGEEIDCHFRRVPGYLHAALDGTKDESNDLRKEADLARELGFDASFEAAVPEVRKPGIRFANQAKFHPLRYLSALAKAFVEKGGEIYEQTEATEFAEAPRTVTANGKKIECDYIVIATHVPLLGETGVASGALFQTKLASYTSYVIGARIPKGRIAEASFWDTADPYYYLRIDQGETNDYAIFGGQDHKTGQASDGEARFSDLEKHLKALIPEAEFNYRWSGQVVETDDGLPFIGETAKRQFAATGFSGNGMTFGTLAAMMACDAATGRVNAWQELLDVSRKKLNSTWELLAENIDYPYYLVRDLVTRAKLKSVDAIGRGEGAVLKVNGKQAACSRDLQGNIHCVSAVCTHMGCIVNWNSVEKSWDCPCHGSRFDPSGAVLAGPAETALEKIDPNN